jgi:glycerophosphoryl diester phosphodiesterase
VPFEIQAHRANDAATLRRLLATRPSSVEVDVGVDEDGVVVAHDYDLSDASGLSLERVVELAGSTRVVVEAKCAPPDTAAPKEFAHALRPFLRGVAVCSSEERVLNEVRRRSSAPTTFLFDRPMRIATVADTLGPRYDLVTSELIRVAHAIGLRVVPWTVNDVRHMAHLIALGVDGLVTDEPSLAREVLAGSALAA